MKDTVTKRMFIDGMRRNFSYEALDALFDWFEEYEDCTGEELEYDPIGFSCVWSEYGTEEEAKDQTGIEPEEELEDFYTVVRFKGGLLIGH